MPHHDQDQQDLAHVRPPVAAPSRHLWIWPALLLAIGTIACRLFPLDQRSASLFYSTSDGTWLGDSIRAVRFLQAWGDYPSVLLGIAALYLAVVFVGSKRLQPWRRAGLYLVLCLALCHLLVNTGLKKHYNRARPKETVLWGGQRPFTPLLQYRGDERGRSFPSGHAAAGFSFVAIYFAFRDRKRALARAGLALGLAHGLVNGAGRVLQGAHFPSDVLWSFGVVWFTCWGLYRWYYRPSLRPRGSADPPARGRPRSPRPPE